MSWKFDRTRLITPALLIGFVLIWHFYVTWFNVSKFIVPPPLEVWDALVELLTTPSTLRHTWATLYETLLGFLFASIMALRSAPHSAKHRGSSGRPIHLSSPRKSFLRWRWCRCSSCGSASAPNSKIVVAAVLAFFPILTNTVLGIKSVDYGHRDVMTVLNANRWQNFVSLELPSSLPAVLAGMEVGIVLAIIGAVVGEYLGGATGLGYLLVASMNNYKVGMLFAVILLLTVIGFLLYLLIGVLRRLVIPWHESARINERAAMV